MNNSETKKVIRIAVVAALYVALTYAFGWMSYGEIQFRIAEILVLLCFFRKDYAISLIIGCAIANIMSPLGFVDVACGTFATLLSVIGVMHMKNIYIAGIFPVVCNAIIVALELWYLLEVPLIFGILTVGFGELVVICVGIVIFKSLKNNKSFMVLIDANQNV